jgi:hypothetical protein
MARGFELEVCMVNCYDSPIGEVERIQADS